MRLSDDNLTKDVSWPSLGMGSLSTSTTKIRNRNGAINAPITEAKCSYSNNENEEQYKKDGKTRVARNTIIRLRRMAQERKAWSYRLLALVIFYIGCRTWRYFVVINSNVNKTPFDGGVDDARSTRKIPHILQFTYVYNILERKEPWHLHENILDTIQLYKKAIEKENDAISASNIEDKVQVRFIDKNDCREMIEQTFISLIYNIAPPKQGLMEKILYFVYIRLYGLSKLYDDAHQLCKKVTDFVLAKNDRSFSDVCRLSALYLHGGYFFDVDRVATSPILSTYFEKDREPAVSGGRSRNGDESVTNVRGVAMTSQGESKVKDKIAHDEDETKISFMSVKREGVESFESVVACTPRHEIIATAYMLALGQYTGNVTSLSRDEEDSDEGDVLYKAYKVSTSPRFEEELSSMFSTNDKYVKLLKEINQRLHSVSGRSYILQESAAKQSSKYFRKTWNTGSLTKSMKDGRFASYDSSFWNSSTTIPHILWFTHKDNILETKTPSHIFRNVQKTIGSYSEILNGIVPHETVQVEFMDDDYCLSMIRNATTALINTSRNTQLTEMHELAGYFLSEKDGSYKSDICRLAALYLHGGYYFDTDMEIAEPVIAETYNRPITHLRQNVGTRNADPITFITVKGQLRNHFFQSFLACNPKHPIIDKALRLTVEYYKGRLDWMTEEMMVGPYILWNAYEVVTGVNPALIGGNGVISRKTESTHNELLRRPEEEEKKDRVYYGTRILQEDFQDDAIVNNGVKRDNSLWWGCKFIVHDGYGVGYFYSRVQGSHNCMPARYNFCGGGEVGNGVCREDQTACCSKYGWCGHGVDFCGSNEYNIPDPGVCGNGQMGTGVCKNKKECCSLHGYCGTGPEYCGVPGKDLYFCGDGNVNNGVCEEEDMCCSKYGWCGKGPGYCD